MFDVHATEEEDKLVLLCALDRLGGCTEEQLLRFVVETELVSQFRFFLALSGLKEASLVRETRHLEGTLLILTPEGKPDEEWKAHMLGQLAPYQEKLTSMQRLITEMMDAKGINAWARLNFEYCETAVYMVMKLQVWFISLIMVL